MTLNCRHGREAAGTRDEGSATIEYALVTLAAAGLAGLLVALLKSDAVREALAGLVTSALGS